MKIFYYLQECFLTVNKCKRKIRGIHNMWRKNCEFVAYDTIFLNVH